MHEHHHFDLLATLFTTANIAIAVGYLSVPFLVLRYLPLTKLVLFWGAVFFLGCSGTHIGMALFMHHVTSLFWTVEHVLQAIGTWGFIISFTRMLRAAAARRGGGDEL